MSFITTYREVQKGYSFSGRRQLRQMVLACLSAMDSFSEMNRYLDKPRIQFLYFHHVFRDESNNLEILLKFLSKNHTFISYSDAVKLIWQGKIDRPYICFSSDDGFKNNMIAAKILADYGASSCFFINPAIVGETDFRRVEHYCREKLNLPAIEFLSWEDTLELLSMGHEIGSHSMNHARMNTLNDAELWDAVHSSFESIKANCRAPNHFAFPYGNFTDFTEKAKQMVFKSGFESCASAQRGCHINTPGGIKKELLCIHRDHIILDWEKNHIRYFILRNSKNANPETSLFPYLNP